MVRHQAVLTDTSERQLLFLGLPLLGYVGTSEAKRLNKEKRDETVVRNLQLSDALT